MKISQTKEDESYDWESCELYLDKDSNTLFTLDEINKLKDEYKLKCIQHNWIFDEEEYDVNLNNKYKRFLTHDDSFNYL